MASRRQRRREVDWDYKKLGSTGERVLKPRNLSDEDRMSNQGDEPTGEVNETVMKTTDEMEARDSNVVGTSVGDTLKTLNLKTLTNNEAEFYEEIQEFLEKKKLSEASTIPFSH